MTPSERTMPTVDARWSELDRRWVVALPGHLNLPARDEAEAEDLARKYGCGASVRYLRPPGNQTRSRAG